jgi:hypothetical protein
MFDKDINLAAWSHAQFGVGLAFFLHAEMAKQEIAEADLENALSCFDAAEPGFRSLKQHKNLKKLELARTETADRLKKLRTDSNRT